MGAGVLRDGLFNLKLSARFWASDEELRSWQQAMQAASNLLHHATGGHHRIGRVLIANSNTGGKQADAHLLVQCGRSHSQLAGIGLPNAKMVLCYDEQWYVHAIVHELGHYAYDLRDEYLGVIPTPQGPTEVDSWCIGEGNYGLEHACIMEAGAEFGDMIYRGEVEIGVVDRFCTPANHRNGGSPATKQEHVLHCSCWQAMINKYPTLVYASPPRGVPSAANRKADDIDWVKLAEEQRFVLAMDCSNAMSPELTQAAATAASSWVYLVETGAIFTAIMSSELDSPVVPRTKLETGEQRDGAAELIQAISPTILPPNGVQVLEAGHAEHRRSISHNGLAANQVLAIVSGGFHLDGLVQDEWIRRYQDDAIRIEVVGVGDTDDATTLQRLAIGTCGSYYHVGAGLSSDEQAAEITDALVQISSTSNDNDDAVYASEPSPAGRVGGEFRIEEGSEATTVTAVWRSPGASLVMEVLSPSRERFGSDRRAEPKNGFLIGFDDDREYQTIHLGTAEPGLWTYIVRPGPGSPPEGDPGREYRLFAFSRNPNLDGGLFLPKHEFGPGEPIPVHMRVFHRMPLSGLTVKAGVRVPGGDVKSFRLEDHGDTKDGDDFAGDGVYSGLFHDTADSGVYEFRVAVEAGGGAFHPDFQRRGRIPLSVPVPQIPRFQRFFRITAIVTAS